jgi:hypothetical protein
VSHELIDEISLELGRRTATRLRQQPDLLQLAHDNLARWSKQNANAPAEWRELLHHPLEEICAVLTSENDEGQRLRQNSPFAGVLNAREVWELKHSFRHATPAA